MELINFLKLIKYKPVWISEPSNIDDGIQNIEFRRIKNFTASIEFGREFNEEKNGYYFYYEIIDWNNYKEMEFIPFSSPRRHDVIFCWPNSDDEYKKLTEKINESLKRHYRR
jgi:hypothetical protein